MVSALVRGRSVAARSLFDGGSFRAGHSRTIRVKIRNRGAWLDLIPGTKSGSLVISVNVTSNNGLRTTQSLRIGLRR